MFTIFKIMIFSLREIFFGVNECLVFWANR